MSWTRLADTVTSRRSWVLVLLATLGVGMLMALGGGHDSNSQSPVSLPPSAESARAAELAGQFPGGDRAPAILVVTRTDGGLLTPDDQAAADAARARIVGHASDGVRRRRGRRRGNSTGARSCPDSPSTTRCARCATRPQDGLPGGLRAQVTGGPAFGADIANAFSGANITLLAVTASVVALLLILTYRSPVLWLVPLLVVAFADRAGSLVGEALTSAAGLTADGSTAGITSVLVFGAGTNYALLLISRYREELRHEPDHRSALRTAVRTAAPAIVASNATVVLALLTLLFATSPSTRSLGLQAASGLVVAAVFSLFVLPPLLAVCGVRLFWPFIPRPGGPDPVTTGMWHRIAESVARRPVWVAATSITLLAALATGLLGVHTGLSQTEQFRIKAESVTGYETVAAHFPGGLTDPIRVIGTHRPGPASSAGHHRRRWSGVRHRSRSTPRAGLTQWSVVTDVRPGHRVFI